MISYGQQQPESTATEFQTLAFFWNSMLSRVRTSHPVKVVAVHGGGVGPIGTVDVQPLVGQIDGQQTVVPHATLYGLPYCRVQGGLSAVILDPAAGDIGLACFCDRDISAVKGSLQPSPPGSLRRFNFSDGIYVGCAMTSTTPTQYVEFLPNAGGITIKSPGTINLNGATISAEGEITDAKGVVLGTHIHSGVTTGGGNTGQPV